jgi:hypothetical protein
LANACGGSFCPAHELEYGAKCHVCECTSQKVAGTQACNQHHADWTRYQGYHNRQRLSGFRRMVRRPGERLPWEPIIEANTQPHNEAAPEIQRTNYFTPRRFYCVETICAPCGVVVAWAKFADSESPTNILQFLESVYPTEESRPDYICIDKGCLVLRTSVSNGSWETWKRTSRFIVDSYHYNTHRVSDVLCRKYCNPAPQDGSAPNLVVVEHDNHGRPYYKHAFNTQVCEQLNAWLGGFETILQRMTIGNFNWFLHSMLFYHTQIVIARQQSDNGNDSRDNSDSDSSDSDI